MRASRVCEEVVEADGLEPAVQRGSVGDGVRPHDLQRREQQRVKVTEHRNWSQGTSAGHIRHPLSHFVELCVGPLGLGTSSHTCEQQQWRGFT